MESEGRPPARAAGRLSAWRKHLRDGALAGAIGMGVGIVITPERGAWPISSLLASSAGIAIFVTSSLLAHWLDRPLHRLERGMRIAAFGAIFLCGGAAAWLVMYCLACFVLHVHLGGNLETFAMTTALAVVIGFTFYSFGRIRERLAESVARLKEAEFAEKELELARALQRRLLPPAELAGNGYRVAARNLPARIVAGDFYDVFPLAGGRLGVAVADVAGKGMAAALIMATVKAMLPLIAAERSTSQAMRELNRRLARELSRREFVALALAIFDPQTGAVQLANAGLPDPYLFDGLGVRPIEVPGPRLPLGMRGEVAYLSLDLRLAPGERLVMLTDGLAEAPGASDGPGGTAAGEPLGYSALSELLEHGEARAAPLAWLDGLLARLQDATGPVLADDWTVLVLEKLAPASADLGIS